jgi:protoheme IX farnesyltransferase
MTPWLLFAVIFFWTPPHFWALALCLKEDYKAVRYPMMPLVAGDEETLRQMLWYTIVTVGLTLALFFSGVGLLYLLLAVGLGIGFVYLTWHLAVTREKKDAWSLFGFSIVYLLVLFVGLMVDNRFIIQPWVG